MTKYKSSDFFIIKKGTFLRFFKFLKGQSFRVGQNMAKLFELQMRFLTHLSYLPFIPPIGQFATKHLNSISMQQFRPCILVGQTDHPICGLYFFGGDGGLVGGDKAQDEVGVWLGLFEIQVVFAVIKFFHTANYQSYYLTIRVHMLNSFIWMQGDGDLVGCLVELVVGIVGGNWNIRFAMGLRISWRDVWRCEVAANLIHQPDNSLKPYYSITLPIFHLNPNSPKNHEQNMNTIDITKNQSSSSSHRCCFIFWIS